MLKKYLSALIFFLIVVSVNAQKKLKAAGGEWAVIPYAPNVVKLVFQPTGYTANENITNAVIARPLLQTPAIKISHSFNSITLDKGKSLTLTAAVFADGYQGFSMELANGEKIFGGGERALPLNRRGYKFPLYNNPWYGYSNGADALNFSVPFFTSSNGYALFFDNPSKGYVDIGKTKRNRFDAGFSSGELNVYVIFGNDYKEILSSYFKLTGTQPLPPRWAMGNFMSRFGYTDEAQTKEIAFKMKQEGIPFDGIIYDLFWFGDSIKKTMGNLDWVNKKAWPNPKKMIGDFARQNIHSVLIAEPFVLEGTKSYDSTEKYFAVDCESKPYRLMDFYFGYGGLIDIFRKDAASSIWKNHYKKQLANGVTGWWTDLGEPEKHPSDMMHNMKSLGIKRLMGADEVHNVYGHYWNKMLFENYAKELPNQRLFHLNRSGFAGSQRYSIFPWSGDVSRSWSGLQAQVPLMLGMSMSGIPYIHADAGGFAGGDGDNELYVRWLQFAVFTPIFRPHGTALYEKDCEAFSFPSEPALIDSVYRQYAKQAVWLRYLMLPYNYTLSYKQASKGEPLVAPLYYHYPTDTAAVNVNDEFMWGENILVAPVLAKKSRERKVYLPQGKWYDFFDTTNVIGGGVASRKISISHIPVFVKEGSFIPIASNSLLIANNTKDYMDDDIKVIYYPSEKESNGILYYDDGETKNSPSEIINFNGITTGNNISIEITTGNKGYYLNNKKRQLLVGIPARLGFPEAGKRNGKTIAANEITKAQFGFNKNCTYEFINIEFKGEPVKLELHLPSE